jgi:hypothetical protein
MKRQALYGVILPYRACMILVLVERGVLQGLRIQLDILL